MSPRLWQEREAIAVTIDLPITSDSVAQRLKDLPPESIAEVARFIEFLQFKARPAVDVSPRALTEHPAFGLWADRKEIEDAVDFTRDLRRMIEERRDSYADHAPD